MSALSVTLPNSIQKRAQVLADTDGISLDQFITAAVAEKIAALDASEYLRARAARGDRSKFERVLAKVPDVEPERGDEISPAHE
jgi:hypothetical protein